MADDEIKARAEAAVPKFKLERVLNQGVCVGVWIAFF